ncbi:ADP-forming succinate--CoA ligase subunit beta [Candidatus Magnetaquicoccus inordinatus]|uniref:ADP-forming succinate--CoA ligase subunit beta n=1 Tax=Candidatus Magnetaquicoccus inordinatus TaxID=2496818 RepID=UPI00102C5B7A|nr:ADP-forming succinate--CoA ligase subunit beta [Candidatus Magnetaquicoccus inordinatus]
MNIHEYQAKKILAGYGVKVPRGQVVFSVEEAEEAAKKLDSGTYVVKAQIHAGGRGKGGGVKLARNLDDVTSHAQNILGMTLVTHQTGPAGKVVKRLYVEEGCNIARELYLGLVVDRGSSRITMMASTEGGMEIEKVAAETPDKIIKEVIDPAVGLGAFQARNLAYGLGLVDKQVSKAVQFMTALYNAFIGSDASLVEINPLVVTVDGDIMALDAKMNFDDNALYRHKDIAELRDLDEEDSKEIEASKFGLNYIALDGSIGCMVNGAGLAMATMDIIQLKGAKPANFLDVGGGATTEVVTEALKLILSDPNVKAVLINIFGGIMRCDVIANGVVTAARDVNIKVPLVVRLEGTNVDLGKKILAESGLAIISADDLNDAAEKAVAAVR